MRRPFVFLFILILVIPYFALFAGNTGKIVGIVVDKNTGEPLIGVNIFLRGTSIGASSDVNGEFIILNIPPGKYDVECSYVGYQTIVLKQVRIMSDQTTTLDFKMAEQTMDLGEQIEVVAERPLVQKDLTSSKKITSEEEIKALPVETFAGIMLTQAGVTKGANGELHIRGGRSTEISYLVDGISVANPYSTNGLATGVATNAIQEMSVVSGAFNAEYGNAMSGVVNFTTKDGTSEFHPFISFYSGDYVSSHTDIFTNIDDINPLAIYVAEGTLSGPLSFLGLNGQENTFFLSARYSSSEGYLYGIREHLTTDSSNFNPKKHVIIEKDEDQITTRIIYTDEWYVENKGDSAIVPMNPSNGLNLLGKLKFRLSPSLVLRLQSIYQNSWYKSYNHAYKYVPDGIYQNLSDSWSHSLNLTHTLSPSTFYQLRLGYNTRDYKRYVFEDYKDPRYAPSNKIKGSPGGTTFLFGGQQNGHDYQYSQTYQAKLDFTSQVDKNNLVKFGFEGRLNVLDREYYSIGYDRNVYQEPTKVYGGIYTRYPRQFSAYLQDKLEYKDVIINAGLRYDYFYSDAEYAVDELQPDGKRAMAQPKNMVAPRLGVSFPITAKGIIHLSYGHFYQMPPLASLYTNPDFILPASGTPLFGNANLDPEKTISYEIGLQQQFGNMFSLDVTGFYKDIRDLLAWQTITFERLDGDRQSYRVRRNQDYANVKGVTLSFQKRMTPDSPISATVDYTFQIAEGNDNNPAAFYYNSLSGQETIKKIIPLDWDQTHNLYGSVTVTMMKGLNLSLIGQLSSGYPYTPLLFNTNYDALPNQDRKPWQKNVDFKVSYRFAVGKAYMMFFLKVYNLFDTLNERYVFNDTGRASYTFRDRAINEPESFKKHYGEPGVHTYDEYNIRPQYYTAPRQVRIGVTFEF